MEDITATIRADLSSFQASMRQMVSEVQKASQQSAQHVSSLDRSLQGLATAAKTVGVAVAAMGLAQLGKEAVQASTQMTALDNAFKAMTGSATAAKAELGFVRAESQRLGLNFVSTAEQFKGLTAAARGTALEGEAIRKAFSAVAGASQTLGLSTEQTGGVLTALQQMISKGTVSAEELRGQLGERLPGAFQVAARALGVTTTALGKMLEQGEVLATDFIPKFSAQLERELGGGATAAAQTFQAAMNRIQNAVTELGAAIGDLLTQNPQVVRGLNAVAEGIAAMAQAAKEGHGPLAALLGLMGQIAETTGTFLKQQAGGRMAEIAEQTGKMGKELMALREELERLQQPGPLRMYLGVEGVAQRIAEVTARITALDAAQTKLFREQAQAHKEAAGLVIPLGEDEPTRGSSLVLRKQIQALNLPLLKEVTKEYANIKQQITAIQALLTAHREGLAILDPGEVVVLTGKLKVLEDQFKKTLGQLTSTEVTAAQKKAFQEDEAHANKIIGLMRDREAAQEKLDDAQEKRNQERIADELHAMETIQGYRDKFATEALKTEEEKTKAYLAVQAKGVEGQLKQHDEAKRAFEAFQNDVRSKTADILFDFTKGLTDGATQMKDVLAEHAPHHPRPLLAHAHRDGRQGVAQGDPHSCGPDRHGGRRPGLQRPAPALWRPQWHGHDACAGGGGHPNG